jgi:hypothetical protein
VQVAGPTFSGSVESLIKAIKAIHQQSPLHFHIVSGSITSQSPISDLQGNKAIADASFTTMDDDTALCAFAEYLGITSKAAEEKNKQNEVDIQLATVTEEDKNYGHSIRSTKPAECNTYPVLSLKFPRGLSRLRAAYQENLASNAGNGSNQQALQRLPPLNLTNERNSDEDQVPVFAKTQTPQGQESQMLQLAAALRWGRINPSKLSHCKGSPHQNEYKIGTT